ncbi:uncharacterized protein LOC129772834 [Toxorhynchites rutilus septentrionalis]|uniref:uncharacterized protein LOC129772834 n=1 Tax=Toxorhynchites rutilus septentrionalis TaxID=329112 RepID=UPI002478CEBD|nr:uncharacterized protein LOC129772834 [Toxorhynchites rutilus septentrionalis]
MKTIAGAIVFAIIGLAQSSVLPLGLSPLEASGTIIRSDLGLPSLIRSDLGLSAGLPLATIPSQTLSLASGLPAAVSIRSASPIALNGLSPITLSSQGTLLPLAGNQIISTNSGILRSVSPIALAAQSPIATTLPLNIGSIVAANNGILSASPIGGSIVLQKSLK